VCAEPPTLGKRGATRYPATSLRPDAPAVPLPPAFPLARPPSAWAAATSHPPRTPRVWSASRIAGRVATPALAARAAAGGDAEAPAVLAASYRPHGRPGPVRACSSPARASISPAAPLNGTRGNALGRANGDGYADLAVGTARRPATPPSSRSVSTGDRQQWF
jgi:hypothetical protein